MKKFNILLIYLSLTGLLAVSLARALRPADDTTTLQSILNGGNVSLPAGHVYNITGTVNVMGIVNMNGATINTSSTTLPAVKLTTDGSSISNGTIRGPCNYTTAYNSYGSYGIRILCNNAGIHNIHITKFPSYGIFSTGAYQNPSITSCAIDTVGYTGFYFDAEAAYTTGGNFSNNTVDRSMLPNTAVHEADVEIRGSVSIGVITNGWTISGNILKMPSLPTIPSLAAAECMEVRWMTNSTVSNNVCIAGTIGISCVHDQNVTVSGTNASGQNLEGIEFANSNHCSAINNKANETVAGADAALVDGPAPYSWHIRFARDTFQTTTGSPLHCAGGEHYIQIDSSSFKGSVYAMNLKQTDSVYLTDTKIDMGGRSGSAAMQLDQGHGRIFFTRGSVNNSSYIIFAYNTGLDSIVDNITGLNVNLTGTAQVKSGTFSNGAHFGTNISFASLPAPLISYSPNIKVLNVGTLLTTLTPVNTGGAITSYSVTPALPPGLSFNTGTGVITGTPTLARSLEYYTVMASNLAGSSSTVLTLTVNSPLIIPATNIVKRAGHIPKAVH